MVHEGPGVVTHALSHGSRYDRCRFGVTRGALRGTQLPSPRRRRREGPGRLGVGRRGHAVSRLPCRLFGGQPGTLPPEDPSRRSSSRRHRVTLTSRAFRNDQLPLLLERLHDAVGHGHVAADELGGGSRRDGAQGRPQVGLHRSRASPRDRAEIIACENNFHGRTTTIVSFSTDAQYREGSGRSPRASPSSRTAIRRARAGDHAEHRAPSSSSPSRAKPASWSRPTATCARPRRSAAQHNVLFIVDEIQSGLGRPASSSPSSTRM